MLEYEWTNNPSTIIISGDEPTQEPDPSRNHHVFDPYGSHNFSEPAHFINPETHFTPNPFQQNPNFNTQFTNYYDSLAYRGSGSSYQQGPGYGPTGFMVPKSEPVGGFSAELSNRIGLNLGGRTYFSSSEDDFVNRLYRRSRILEPGSVNVPRCQAEGCDADLTQAKHYHRRHKVCEFHSKSSTVIAAGLTQRFCQQCSRFHLLTEFDNGKRSCRRRLADHNRRRRKSNQSSQENGNKAKVEKDATNSSSENPERSPQDSGRHSSSSVTVAVSPPRISLDYFGGRSYGTTSSTASTSSSSLFYSNS